MVTDTNSRQTRRKERVYYMLGSFRPPIEKTSQNPSTSPAIDYNHGSKSIRIRQKRKTMRMHENTIQIWEAVYRTVRFWSGRVAFIRGRILIGSGTTFPNGLMPCSLTDRKRIKNEETPTYKWKYVNNK